MSSEEFASNVSSGAIRTARAVFSLARPRTCLIGVLTFALGVDIGSRLWEWPLLCGAAVSFLIPFLGNIHNAITDLKEDEINLPGRTRTVRDIGESKLKKWVILLGILTGLLAIVSGLVGACVVSVCLAGTWCYSRPPIRAKERPVFGLVVFSQIVGLPFLYGVYIPTHSWHWSAVNGQHPGLYRILILLAFISVTFVAKGLLKNVPDYSGDREAGVRTSASICPTQRTAALIAFWSTVVVYASLAAVVLFGLLPSRCMFALVWIVPVAANGLYMVKHEDRPSQNLMLKRDMLITFGYFATLLVLNRPRGMEIALAVCGCSIILVSDRFGLDSRKPADLDREEGADEPVTV